MGPIGEHAEAHSAYCRETLYVPRLVRGYFRARNSGEADLTMATVGKKDWPWRWATSAIRSNSGFGLQAMILRHLAQMLTCTPTPTQWMRWKDIVRLPGAKRGSV